MPWHVTKSDTCPTSRPWAVIKDTTGETEACHATRADAERHMAALYANEPGMHAMTYEDEVRAKYNADQLAALGAKGHAYKMPDGSWGYPTDDEEDLSNAIHAVGRGTASHDALRRYIMRRARAMGLSRLIPDNWNADGSKMASAATPALSERSVPFELTRQAEGGDGLTLEGYAAVFNSPTAIHDWQGEYTETIAPGAFKRSINAGTPVLMFEHGKHPVVGSMPIGKIQTLREDARGLHVKARLFDHWMTEPIRAAIQAGAIDGMSFRFEAVQEEWNQAKNARTLRELKVPELGPVVFPAYKDTSVSLRSLEPHVPGLTLTLIEPASDPDPVSEIDQLRAELAELRAWLAERSTPKEPASSASSTSEGPADPADPASRHSALYGTDRAARLKRGRELEASRKGIGRKKW